MQILSFRDDVIGFLRNQGIDFAYEGKLIRFLSKHLDLMLVPLDETLEMLPSSHSACQWEQKRSKMIPSSIPACQWEHLNAHKTVFLYEDRWKEARNVTSLRLLARLGKFKRVHARLCKVISEENCSEAGMSPAAFSHKVRKFLDTYHTYGFLKGQKNYALVYKENIVAASQFMQTYRPQNPETPILRAYEWTRYASLPDIRIAGGMGKILEQFVRDVRMKERQSAELEECRKKVGVEDAKHTQGFEVMSYSDNEWGEGDVYRKLGFHMTGSMPPVTYRIDPKTFERINPRQWALLKIPSAESVNYPVIQNRGSLKWKKIY